jgi:polyisoprenoid-binding protein YceI
MSKRLSIAAVAASVTLSLLPTASADATVSTYSKVDINHSDVSFQIRHIVSKVRGEFEEFSARIVKDDADPAKSSVEFRIKAASIDTDNANRDDDLRSKNLFEVDKYPEIVFVSKKVEKVSENEYRVTGDLTMRGVTKEVVLPVSFDGELKDQRGNVKAGFSTTARLDRKDFGITWNRALDNGGVLLGDDVDVTISLGIVKD